MTVSELPVFGGLVVVTDTDPAVIEATPVAPADFQVADLAALVEAACRAGDPTGLRASSAERSAED